MKQNQWCMWRAQQLRKDGQDSLAAMWEERSVTEPAPDPAFVWPTGYDRDTAVAVAQEVLPGMPDDASDFWVLGALNTRLDSKGGGIGGAGHGNPNHASDGKFASGGGSHHGGGAAGRGAGGGGGGAGGKKERAPAAWQVKQQAWQEKQAALNKAGGGAHAKSAPAHSGGGHADSKSAEAHAASSKAHDSASHGAAAHAHGEAAFAHLDAGNRAGYDQHLAIRREHTTESVTHGASEASAKAARTGAASDHARAADAHADAGDAHRAANNADRASHHWAESEKHSAASSEIASRPATPAAAAPAKSSKSGFSEQHFAKTTDEANSATRDANNASAIRGLASGHDITAAHEKAAYAHFSAMAVHSADGGNAALAKRHSEAYAAHQKAASESRAGRDARQQNGNGVSEVHRS